MMHAKHRQTYKAKLEKMLENVCVNHPGGRLTVLTDNICSKWNFNYCNYSSGQLLA